VNARKIQGQKAIAREMFVRQAAHANAEVSASPTPGDTICPTKSKQEYTLESTAQDGFYEPVRGEFLLMPRLAWERVHDNGLANDMISRSRRR
jgi:hypothetical protein